MLNRITTPTLALALGLVGVACSSQSPPPPPKAIAAAPITLAFPDLVVAPGIEQTQCVVMRLGNVAPLHVGAVHNVLGDASHHLIVYAVNDTVEQKTPFPCHPFTDTLDPTKGAPLMVTQKHDDLLTLPSGVAYSIVANQMIRLEMHYINASAAPKTVHATTTLMPISDDDFHDEAGFLFIGNPDIKLPPKSETKVGPSFFEIPHELSGVKFFAMTGHEHQLGTNVQVAMSTTWEDPGKMVYDVPGWLWSEPKTEFFETPFTVPDDGGFTFTCSWNNTTDQQVGFGESANNEMCFFWAYYYPSQGARVCFHTSRIGGVGGGDICCPGDALCGFAKDFGGGKGKSQ
jgi:Copper type II ascorbate-dependent monooxygenase, C-terminal domain